MYRVSPQSYAQRTLWIRSRILNAEFNIRYGYTLECPHRVMRSELCGFGIKSVEPTSIFYARTEVRGYKMVRPFGTDLHVVAGSFSSAKALRFFNRMDKSSDLQNAPSFKDFLESAFQIPSYFFYHLFSAQSVSSAFLFFSIYIILPEYALKLYF